MNKYNVVVHRPENVIPTTDEPLGLGQMYARDPIVNVEDLTLNTKPQIPMRQKEIRGFITLLDSMLANNDRVESLIKANSYLEREM